MTPSRDTFRLLSNDYVHVIWHHDPNKKIVVLAIPKQERFLDDMGRSQVAETRGAAASRQVLFEVNEHPGLRVVEFVWRLRVGEQPSVGLEELRRSAVVLGESVTGRPVCVLRAEGGGGRIEVFNRDGPRLPASTATPGSS
jgi:hypothetical protein